MFLDSLTRIATQQAFTATALTTNSIDLGVDVSDGFTVQQDVETGEPMGFMVSITTAIGGTTPTFEIDIISDTSAALTAAPITISQTVVPATQVTAGARFIVPLPKGMVYDEFLGVKIVLGGTSPTVSCTVDFGPLRLLSIEPKIYPKNFPV